MHPVCVGLHRWLQPCLGNVLDECLAVCQHAHVNGPGKILRVESGARRAFGPASPAPETKASVRRSEDWLSPGTTMQKRLAIMDCSMSRCQSALLPAPCACSLLHFSAGAFGCPAYISPQPQPDAFSGQRMQQQWAHHACHGLQQLPHSRRPHETCCPGTAPPAQRWACDLKHPSAARKAL